MTMVRELRPLKGELLNRFFQREAAGLSAAAIDKGHTVSDTHSVAGPVTVTDDFSVPGYSQAQAKIRVFELPSVTPRRRR